MKIAIVGASGTIGKAVVKRLEKEHEVIKMGRSSGDVLIDMSSRESIRTAFDLSLIHISEPTRPC